MSLYPPPATIKAEVFSRMPEHPRKVRTTWADFNKAGQTVDCFLEGPSFDRRGNLWCDRHPARSRVQVSPAGDWTLVAEYDGWPNGLKLHKDGRAFITDYKRGIVCSIRRREVTPLIETVRTESFKGVNDLHFAAQWRSLFHRSGPDRPARSDRPRLPLHRRRPAHAASSTRFPSPNGLVLDLHENVLFVAVTRANAVWRLPTHGRRGRVEGRTCDPASWRPSAVPTASRSTPRAA